MKTTIFLSVPDHQGNFFLYQPQAAFASLLQESRKPLAGEVTLDANGFLHGYCERAGAVVNACRSGAPATTAYFVILRLVMPRSLREQLAWTGKFVGAGGADQACRLSREGVRAVAEAHARGEVEVLLETVPFRPCGGLAPDEPAPAPRQPSWLDTLGAGPTGFGGC